MDEIAVNSNVVLASDWRKVSLALIQSNGGKVKFLPIGLHFPPLLHHLLQMQRIF